MPVAGRLRGLWPPVGLMLGIFMLSSVPGPSAEAPRWSGLVPPALQNLLHIPVFALLAWLWARFFARFERLRPGLVLGGALLISATWGLLDEYHQYHVPGRYASSLDVVLDLVGAVIGALLWWAGGRPGELTRPS